ncbi:MAG: hypothetical protein ACP5GJ_00040 [Nanopusillaceae archaeon]
MRNQLLLEQVLFILLIILFISLSIIFYHNFLSNIYEKNQLIKIQINNEIRENTLLNNQSNLIYYYGYYQNVGTIIIKNS